MVSLAYAWYSFYVPSNNIAWAGDYASAREQAVESGKPMVLFFTATWCVPCRIMKRTVWADEQVTAEVNAAVVPVMIDVGDPALAEAVVVTASHRHRSRSSPTRRAPRCLSCRDGGMNKAEFLELLNSAVGGDDYASK
ncbi:MAG: thioredoxin family protein [Phycisphaerales bacterium]